MNSFQPGMLVRITASKRDITLMKTDSFKTMSLPGGTIGIITRVPHPYWVSALFPCGKLDVSGDNMWYLEVLS